MKRIMAVLTVISAALILGSSAPAPACVGKTLVIGSINTPNMAAASETMSALITERTGTTVVVRYFASFAECYEAVKKGEADIVLDYTGRCYVDVMGRKPEADAAKVFSAVKETYQRDMNLVWLEPLGFSDPGAVKGGGTPAMAAPVVRKDTLTKFPALPRVINKLAGRLGNDVVSKIAAEGGNGKSKKAARKFLKDNRLI